MEIGIFILIFLGVLIISTIVFFFLVTIKWSIFGFKVWYHDMTHKGKIGYLWRRDASNNLRLPTLMNLDKLKKDIGDDTFAYTREQLNGCTLFGKPFVIFDSDDNKTSWGLYCQESDEKNAEPLYYKDKSGNYLKDSNGERIPILRARKPSVTMPPSFHQSLVSQQVLVQLRSKLYSILNKYQTVLYIVAGIGIGIAVNAYFSYQTYSVEIPLLKQSLQSVAQACQTVIQ